jgi:hypothetical protein
MGQATSFICEHTAEYILVPKLKEILRKRFDIVTPIYPWASREGSNISKELHKHAKFKVVGLYPRRPKFTSTDKPKIIVKINEQILLGAQTGIKLGIPVIAGCPLVKNFWELGNNPDCIWIKLNQGSTETFELELGHIQYHDYMNQISKFIFTNEEDLLTYLSEKSELIDINSAILSFREIKKNSAGLEFYSYFIFMGLYKPVYFLLK